MSRIGAAVVRERSFMRSMPARRRSGSATIDRIQLHASSSALEAEAGFLDDSVLHGEAVALGCVLAFRLSERLGRVPAQAVRRVERLTALAGLPTEIEALGLFEPDALIARMAGDKKAEGGVPVLILADAIGHAEVVRDVAPAELRAVLQ